VASCSAFVESHALGLLVHVLCPGFVTLFERIALFQQDETACPRLVARQRQVDGVAGPEPHLAAPAEKIVAEDPALRSSFGHLQP
jgi:hypothetical protein